MSAHDWTAGTLADKLDRHFKRKGHVFRRIKTLDGPEIVAVLNANWSKSPYFGIGSDEWEAHLDAMSRTEPYAYVFVLEGYGEKDAEKIFKMLPSWDSERSWVVDLPGEKAVAVSTVVNSYELGRIRNKLGSRVAEIRLV